MHKQDRPGKPRCVGPEPTPGEFDDLLRQIEKEAVPERLLELARRLQAVLAESRVRRDGEARSTEARPLLPTNQDGDSGA